MFSVAQTMQNIWSFMIGKSSPQGIATFAIIWEISDSNAETGEYSPKSGVSQIFIWESWQHYLPRGRSKGRVQGVCPPPPWDDLRFSNTTGILQKKKNCGLLVLKYSKRRVHPLLKKILDPPLNLKKSDEWNKLYTNTTK